MKQWDQFLLHLRGKIDQQVAATQDIQFGEGRIHDQVLLCKNHHFPDFFAYPVTALFFDKVAIHPLRRHI